MKILLLLLSTLLFISSCSQNRTKEKLPLFDKYSHSIVSFYKGRPKADATFSFVRGGHENNAYAITNNHVVTGWSPFEFKRTKIFDTIVMKFPNMNKSVDSFAFPVDVSKLPITQFKINEKPDLHAFQIYPLDKNANQVFH